MKNNIREERLKKNLTQESLANLTNVSRQTIISIETNRYMPSTILSLKLAKVLRRKVEDLFQLEIADLQQK